MTHDNELKRLARRIAGGDPAAARRAAALLDPHRAVWIARRETSYGFEGQRGDTEVLPFSSREGALSFVASAAKREIVPSGRRRLGVTPGRVKAAFDEGDWIGVMHVAAPHLAERDEAIEFVVHAVRPDPDVDALPFGAMPEPFARRWCGDLELSIWPHVAWKEARLPVASRWLDAAVSFSSRASGLFIGKRSSRRSSAGNGYEPVVTWLQSLHDPADQAALDEAAAWAIGKDGGPSPWARPTKDDLFLGRWREAENGTKIPVIRRHP